MENGTEVTPTSRAESWCVLIESGGIITAIDQARLRVIDSPREGWDLLSLAGKFSTPPQTRCGRLNDYVRGLCARIFSKIRLLRRWRPVVGAERVDIVLGADVLRQGPVDTIVLP